MGEIGIRVICGVLAVMFLVLIVLRRRHRNQQENN